MKKIGEKFKSFFNTAGNILKKTWFVGSALFIPIAIGQKVNKKTGQKKVGFKFWNTVKKSAIYLGFYFVVQPLSGLLFPTAEKVLEKNDLPKDVVTMLAPGMEKLIHVRQDNWIGKAHTFFDMQPYQRLNYKFLFNNQPILDIGEFRNSGVRTLAQAKTLQFLTEKHGGYVPVIYLRRQHILKSVSEDHAINASLAKMVETASGGMMTSKLPLTPQEYYMHTFLHEIRHMGKANHSGGLSAFEKEADANYAAAQVLGEVLKDDTFMARYFADMVSNPQYGNMNYDHTFYFLEKETGIGLNVSEQAVFQAYEEAYPVITRLQNKVAAQTTNTCDNNHNAGACDYQMPQNLSELAKLRIKFAQNAMKATYVSPQATNHRYHDMMGFKQKKPQRVRSVPSS